MEEHTGMRNKPEIPDFYDPASNTIEWIDPETWDRKRLFEHYLGADYPFLGITANMDVTKPLAFAHRHGLSFNLVMIYLCNQTADSIENFCYRFLDGKPFRIHHSRPLVNHLKKGSDLFVVGEALWPCDDILTFCKESHEQLEQADPEEGQAQADSKLDIIRYTSIPWISYTSLVRTVINSGKDNAPSFSFGKFFKAPEDPTRVLMPLTSQTHHSLTDGFHVGRFYTLLQKACNQLE